MVRTKHWPLALAVLLAVPCMQAFAAKGGKGRHGTNGEGAERMKWYGSTAEAIAAAKANYIPVMGIIVREGNLDDQRRIKNVESWPQVVDASQESMAAVQIPSQSPEGKEIVARLGIKSLPAVVWLDFEGNPVLAAMLTDSSATITAVLNGWAQTMSGISRFYSDHLTRGTNYLNKGKLRSAYLEYSYLSPFKGKEPDQARQGMDKVKAAWGKLLSKAKELPDGNVNRNAIIGGLRRDVVSLDYAPQLEIEIARAPELAKEAAPAAPAAAADPNKPSAAQPQVPPQPLQAVMPATDNKPLVDAMRVQVNTSAFATDQAEDNAAINLSYLTSHKDASCQEAGKLLQQAFNSYRKAVVDTRELGAERNKLLQSAASDFEKGIASLEKFVEKTPDAQIDKVMQQSSMILYACLKYQSL